MANEYFSHTSCLTLDTLQLLVSVWHLWCVVAVHLYIPDIRDIVEEGVNQDCEGHAEYVGVDCMVRPLKMAVLLPSENPLPDQSLHHLHPTHMIIQSS